eukprot:676335-Hanusia_phi.AAC.1
MGEKVTEYGVHWNFFFTLAFISIFGSLVPVDEKARRRCDDSAGLDQERQVSTICVFAISSGYEILLHRSGLQRYILEADRTDVFSANREGIMGCVGYTSLFLAGVVSISSGGGGEELTAALAGDGQEGFQRAG